MIRYLLILLILAGPVFAFDTKQLPNKTISDQLDEVSAERQAQTSLPVAKDGFWDKLFQCKVTYTNKTHDYSVKLTDEVKKLSGTIVRIPGFMYPLSFEEKQTKILLSKRTPVCFFCPPGEPNEVLYVELAKPTPLNNDLITIEGRFELTNRKEEGIFFVLKDAKLVK